MTSVIAFFCILPLLWLDFVSCTTHTPPGVDDKKTIDFSPQNEPFHLDALWPFAILNLIHANWSNRKDSRRKYLSSLCTSTTPAHRAHSRVQRGPQCWHWSCVDLCANSPCTSRSDQCRIPSRPWTHNGPSDLPTRKSDTTARWIAWSANEAKSCNTGQWSYSSWSRCEKSSQAEKPCAIKDVGWEESAGTRQRSARPFGYLAWGRCIQWPGGQRDDCQ